MMRMARLLVLALVVIAAPVSAEDDQELRRLLFEDPESPVLGNAQGDVTIVEFFDYRCPYCRKVAPDLAALLDRDPGVRLVYKEWPILGRSSMVAARGALAAHLQGFYAPVHEALMKGELDLDDDAIVAFAVSLGANAEQMRADMTSKRVTQALMRNNDVARALGVTGTPAFVIGDTLVPGAVSLEQLEAVVAKARAGS